MTARAAEPAWWRLLLVTHRWTALVAGVVIAVAGASGAIIVFEGAIDRGLHPELWNVPPGSPELPIDTIVARVAAAHPGEPIGGVNPAPVDDRAWTVSAGRFTVFVDPYTGAIKGARSPEEQQALLPRRMHVLHVELFAGPTGRTIVAVAAGVALFLSLSGLVIWWRDRRVAIALGASWKRVVFDLHHLVGVAASLVLVLMTTSALLVHSDALSSAVRSALGGSPNAFPTQPAGPPGTMPSFAAIDSAARATLPGASILFISVANAKAPIQVAMRYPEDHTPGGRSRVFIDRTNGAVLASFSTRDVPLGNWIENTKRSWHTGDIFGKPTEILWLLASLSLVAQAVTGVLMWWNARKGRAAA